MGTNNVIIFTCGGMRQSKERQMSCDCTCKGSLEKANSLREKVEMIKGMKWGRWGESLMGTQGMRDKMTHLGIDSRDDPHMNVTNPADLYIHNKDTYDVHFIITQRLKIQY